MRVDIIFGPCVQSVLEQIKVARAGEGSGGGCAIGAEGVLFRCCRWCQKHLQGALEFGRTKDWVKTDSLQCGSK